MCALYWKFKKVMTIVRKKVTKWYDGDSGEFSDGTKFRLSNVSAPERHQFGAEKATRRAAGMTGQSGGRINWRKVARDRYGREVGTMSNQHGSINQRLSRRKMRR